MSGKTKAELLEYIHELEFQLVMKDGEIEGLNERLEVKDDYIKTLERKYGDKIPDAKAGKNQKKGGKAATANKNRMRALLEKEFIYFRKDLGMSLTDARKKANNEVIDNFGKGYKKRSLDELTDKLIR